MSADERQRLWNDLTTDAPHWCHNIPLRGELWQIALALHRAGILTSDNPKQLVHKLRRKQMLWGAQEGRNQFWVYVSRKWPEDRVKQALAELDRVQSGGRYHPRSTRLPKNYQKYAAHPLQASDELSIAHALSAVEILEEPTVTALHTALAKRGGRLFGTYGDGFYSVYLHEALEERRVHAAWQYLAQDDSSKLQQDTKKT